MKCLIVTCANGLGHARRQLHIAARWASENDVTLLMTKRQYILLKKEYIDLVHRFGNFKIREASPIGLQGPSISSSFAGNYKINKLIQKLIESSDVAYTANVLWPLALREDVIFFGHFLWTDYFLGKSNLNGSVNLYKLLSFEMELASRIAFSVTLNEFTIGDLVRIPNRLSLNLPTYYEDLKLSLDPRKEIWISKGTTNLAQEFNNSMGLDSRLFQWRESHEIVGSGIKPAGIIGRPGLGTIRDCIEFNIPFHPFSITDVELENNVRVINNISESVSLNGLLDNLKFNQIPTGLISPMMPLDDVLDSINYPT